MVTYLLLKGKVELCELSVPSLDPDIVFPLKPSELSRENRRLDLHSSWERLMLDLPSLVWLVIIVQGPESPAPG